MHHQTVSQQPVILSVEVPPGEDIDDDDRDAMTHALQTELEEFAAISEVKRATAEESASGAKGFTDSIGKLVLETLPKSIPAVLGFLKEWVSRPGSRPVTIEAQGSAGSVKVEFDPSTLSTDDIEKLVSTLQAGVK